MQNCRSFNWRLISIILFMVAAFALVHGQRITKCKRQNNRDGPTYRIGSARRDVLNNAPILLLQISIEPDHFNRTDMIALGHRLKEDFCNEKQLSVAICDNYETAKDALLMYELLVHEPNPGLRGGYDLNRVTGEEGISFSTERGKPLDEVIIKLGEGVELKEALRGRADVHLQHEITSGAATSLQVVGDFSNIKHVGDHGYGYALQLWQQGSQIFGLFIAHGGQTGDSPTGLVEGVKCHPRTKQLSFRARLSTGRISKGNYRDVPSRDVFRFRGTVSRNAVKGVLEISDALFTNEPSSKKRIVLRKSAAMTQVMMDSKTYAEWKTWADEILRRLGPKW